MKTSLKVTAFTAALAATFAGALVLGQVIGSPVEAAGEHSMHSAGTAQPATNGAGAEPMPPGLRVSESGYTLSGISAPAQAGEPGRLSFSILDRAGAPIKDFDELHEKRLHLIVLRQDTSGFKHVHPVLDDQGVWSMDWSWDNSGTYKVYADFQPAGLGRNITLARSVDVAGDFAPKPVPAFSNTDDSDGYQVKLNGSLQVGKSTALTATLERDGVPVDNLDPYLGSFGHLVAIRAGDLAYLHVHPEGSPGDGKTTPGPDVTFFAEAPTAGTYRLFLDFKVDGTVHTAEFTVDVAADGKASPTQPPVRDETTEEEGAGDHAEH